MISPVALLIFNRPEVTAQVFAAIAAARPPQLFIAADGPRPGHPDDVALVAATRNAVAQVDWPCEVHRDYAETNLGLRVRVPSALDWVFGTVEEAIILEDDCVPHPSFFAFCDELLTRYRHDTRIAQICGINFASEGHPMRYSYDFSRAPYCWGWASWRRAWQYYDVDVPIWNELHDDNRLIDLLGTEAKARENARMSRDLYHAANWDHQWVFACRAQNMVSIVPRVNLVSNIGFGAGATHTITASRIASFPTRAMPFPLTHPPYVLPSAVHERAMDAMFALPLAERIAARVIPRPLKRRFVTEYKRYAARKNLSAN